LHREAVLILCWVGLYLSLFILPGIGLNLSPVFLIMLLMLTWNFARKEQREIRKLDSIRTRH
jgi:hypothetical protein